MHELEITKHILDVSIQEAKRHGAKAIPKIRWPLDRFQVLSPSASKCTWMCWQKGRSRRGRASRRRFPLRVLCQDCGETSQIDRTHIECPHCHGLHLKRLSGEECMIESLEVDEVEIKVYHQIMDWNEDVSAQVKQTLRRTTRCWSMSWDRLELVKRA